MRMSRRQLWAGCLVAGIIAPGAVATGAEAATGGAGLTTTIQAETPPGGRLVVRFTARNTSATTLNVLTRDLPQVHQSAPVLAVTRDGAPVAYRGRLVKFAATTVADYTRIPPGGSYTTTVNLADDYDLSRPGTYTVGLASGQVRVGGDTTATAPDTDTVRLSTSQAVIRTAAGIPGAVPAAGASAAKTTTETVTTAAAQVTIAYRGCSSSRQAQLQQAVRDAAQYSAKSTSWLTAHTSGGGLYRTWFGTYSSSRFTHVTSAFNSISGELTGRTVTLDCTSTENYMAFVYPNDAYTIYICPGYWPAAPTGYDSKAGTLVHESSHFIVNGGSQDYVYGLAEGRQLASSDPAKAVANADNIEHFAESL